MFKQMIEQLHILRTDKHAPLLPLLHNSHLHSALAALSAVLLTFDEGANTSLGLQLRRSGMFVATMHKPYITQKQQGLCSIEGHGAGQAQAQTDPCCTSARLAGLAQMPSCIQTASLGRERKHVVRSPSHVSRPRYALDFELDTPHAAWQNVIDGAALGVMLPPQAAQGFAPLGLMTLRDVL